MSSSIMIDGNSSYEMDQMMTDRVLGVSKEEAGIGRLWGLPSEECSWLLEI
jgi:hypothetical protein